MADEEKKKPGNPSIVEAGKATQWKPGQTGNPNGRPRTAKYSEAARRLLEEVGEESGETGAEQLAAYCLKMALKGSARHAELFLSYAEGRPKQAMELSGPDGGAMRFENMTEAQLDARLKELLEKYRQEQKA